MHASVKDLPLDQVIKFIADLGLDPKRVEKYTPQDIKKAYRKKALETHPDKGGNEEDFHTVNHAYNMLTNPDYRFKNGKANTPFNLNIDLKVPCSFEDAFFGRVININMSTIKATKDGIWDLEAAEKDGKTEIDVKTFSINVPPGSCNGYRTTLKGKGIQVGSRKGDCFIEVIPNPKPGVQLQGLNIISFVSVPLSIMLRGGKVQVFTMWGVRTAWIAPGTPPEGQVTIKNCGVSKQGHHIAVVKPIYPTQKELKSGDWNNLGIDWKAHEQEIEKERKEEEDLHKRFIYKFTTNSGTGSTGTK